ncbi:MAG: lycopene cyclase domain-containing protein [Chitinophagales bacterium]
MNDTYLLINLATIFIPFIFSFHPKLQFYKAWPAFFPAMFLTAIFFIAWDILFTKFGAWGFNPVYTSGINLIGLPLEELLFFICIPYASVFTYHCFKLLIRKDFLLPLKNKISATLIVSLTIVALFNADKMYTFFTFLLLATTIFILRRADFLSTFYFSYLFLLLPFLLVNGILTGLWIDGEVVWYNELEILGPRIATIPVEDIFYGMLLLLLNIAGMEYFSKRQQEKK